MAVLRGYIYKQRYKPSCVKHHSSWEIPELHSTVGDEYITNVPEVVYYIDEKGHLCGKETTLLW